MTRIVERYVRQLSSQHWRFLIAVLIAMTLIGITQGMQAAPSRSTTTFELYSWPVGEQKWNYALLQTTSRERSAKEITRANLGDLARLKKRISRLPAGSTIVWTVPEQDQSVKASHPTRFGLPPQTIVDEMIKFASTHKVQLRVFDKR